MHVEAGQVQPRRRQRQRHRLLRRPALQREAKLAIHQPRGGFLMRVRIHAGRDPQHHRLQTALRLRDLMERL